MSASPAREAARAAVTRVRERRAWARDVVPQILGGRSLDEREAASAARLAYGTIASSGTLDEALDDRAAKPGRIEPRVRDALQVAAYEILFTDTPGPVAVDQGVELVRSLRPQAASLANAVLRRLAKDAEDFPWGDPASDTGALSRRYAHPLWLTELLVRELGLDAAIRVLQADASAPPLFLATNPFKASVDVAMDLLRADGAEPAAGPLEGCLVAGVPAAAAHSRALSEGLVVVADAAAQLVVRLVPVRPGDLVLEVGSGRGTKTVLLQAAAVDEGAPARIVAVDVHAFKAAVLSARMSFLGVPEVLPVSVDATDPAALRDALGAEADSVLIDAPCSGIGTLRRHPEHRWRLAPADIDALARIGLRLLSAAASLVKPGGFVVYSTCTLTRRENQDVIAAFLEEEVGREFRVDPLGDEVPEGWDALVTEEGYLETLPSAGGPDGHFAARLQRH